MTFAGHTSSSHRPTRRRASRGGALRAVWLVAALATFSPAILAVASVTPASAAGGGPKGFIKTGMTPFQLAVAPGGVQLFHKETPVYGWRVSLLYGVQKKVYGLDMGLFSDAYALKGLQIGLANQVLGEMKGVQVGAANGVDEGKGLQIGFLNRAHSMKGLQIGVLNFNDEGFLPVFPLFNFTP